LDEEDVAAAAAATEFRVHQISEEIAKIADFFFAKNENYQLYIVVVVA
jgi:hypothetical protein